jgi:fatty-acyl-CoA synthase
MGAVLHTLNLRLHPEQVGYVASHAGDYAVIVDASLVPLFAKVLPYAQTIKHVLVTGPPDRSLTDSLISDGCQVHFYEELLAAEPDSMQWPALDERSAAAMCYTSATTGNPKGVVYSHRSMYLHSMALCMGNTFGLSERDRVLPIVPMFHANSWGLPYAAVLAGADLLMPDRYLQAAPLVRMIQSERPTFSGGVPTIWGDVLRHVREHGGDLTSLRTVIGGGAAVPHAMIAAYEAELGVPLVHAWGMTETSPLGSVAHAPAGAGEAESWAYRDSQGRLICTLEARLIGDGGAVLPHDGEAVGEIEVRGPWVTGAYYKDDDPEKFHDGWLRTGDVGNIDRLGFIRLTDRAKDVIKSGGEWISSMELENILMAHPDVTEAAVIGVPDDKWGERPLACVVLSNGASTTAEELAAFLSGRVARWQLPERWSFVDEIPRTSVGKFSKLRMRDAYRLGEYKIIKIR